MRLRIAVVAAMLAGCSPAPPSQRVGEVYELDRELPDAEADAPRYVGVWSAAALGCEASAWRFTERSLTTQGEVSCTFENVDDFGAGYIIDATCTAEAPPQATKIQLSFSNRAGAMMVSGGPWSTPISLINCDTDSM